MRSAATLFPSRRAVRTPRARTPLRGGSRTTPDPAPRTRRQLNGAAREWSGLPRAGVAARPALGRVRPLRYVPRGVIPYVKH